MRISIRSLRHCAARWASLAGVTGAAFGLACGTRPPRVLTPVERDSAVFEATVRQVRGHFPRAQFYVRPLDWPNDSTPNVAGISAADVRAIEEHREATLLGLGARIQASAMLECPQAPPSSPKPPSCVLGMGTSIGLPSALGDELRVSANVRAYANVFTYYFKNANGKWTVAHEDPPVEQ